MTGLPKILLVDYDPRALKALETLFGENGYEVESARDGAAAIAAFQKSPPDVILLEAMIPKKHGFEVCQEIKKSKNGKSIPIIITTAVYKGRKYRTQAMKVHGCDEYIEKPCPPDKFLEIVKKFVPPGEVAKAMAVGQGGSGPTSAHAQKRGEVIPFPSRTGHVPHGDEEAEREIMSKLDEILPDTPIFDERGLNFPSELLDGDEAGTYEIDDEDEDPRTSSGISRTPAKSEPPKGSLLGTDPPKARGKRKPEAMRAEEVMKLTRSRRRPSRPREEEVKRPLIKPMYIFGLVVALVIIVISYFVGKV